MRNKPYRLTSHLKGCITGKQASSERDRKTRSQANETETFQGKEQMTIARLCMKVHKKPLTVQVTFFQNWICRTDHSDILDYTAPYVTTIILTLKRKNISNICSLYLVDSGYLAPRTSCKIWMKHTSQYLCEIRMKHCPKWTDGPAEEQRLNTVKLIVLWSRAEKDILPEEM